jgi:hypothetical protein
MTTILDFLAVEHRGLEVGCQQLVENALSIDHELLHRVPEYKQIINK